ncbi:MULTISPECIES: cytochrome c [Undibacterium]|uniref:cytochrome c n=1 Tax=Undibacterium TaxID=401469 RepID=UPI001E33818C|nr:MULTISPECIES: cytochrome c [Undibacterium]
MRISLWRALASLLCLLLCVVLALAAYGYWGLDERSSMAADSSPLGKEVSLVTITQGAYLAKQANCIGCHTARGGAEYAGGRVLQSEFGNFVSPNITPDKKTGIGEWSANDFWNALHNGKGKHGQLLYPAFPFVNYTHITRADSDAMYAYFQSVTPVEQTNAAHELAFPYNQRAAISLWRALYFRPGELKPETTQSLSWNRGAYLVRGLGHCSACHSARNQFGANQGSADLSGGEMAGIHWYAPSLVSKEELNLPAMPAAELDALLKHGASQQRAVLGPMAEVVKNSLQHWQDKDIAAMREYLQAKKQIARADQDILDRSLQRPQVSNEELSRLLERGQKIYGRHCAECHGRDGEGRVGVYPALKGNTSLQMPSVTNPVRIILVGGFAPSTAANSRPYGMPPFAPFLDDTEVALVMTYIRNSWGNKGSVISPSEVNPYRTAPLD